MWFLFGGVALLLTVVAGLLSRLYGRWRGVPTSIDGQPAWLEVREHKRTVRGFLLGIACPPGLRFRLHDESWIDRCFRRLGANAECSVGDPRFDQRIFIDSDDDRVVGALRDSPHLRHQIVDLRDALGDAAVSWHAQDGRLWVDVSKSDIDVDAWLRRVAAILRLFSEGLTAHASRPGRDRNIWRAALLLATTTALGGGGVVVGLLLYSDIETLVEPSRVRLAALAVGLFAAALLALAAIAWLGTSARTHRVLAEVITVGLFGCVVFANAGLRAANKALDDDVQWQRHDDGWTEAHAYSCGRRSFARTCYSYYLHLPGGLADPQVSLHVVELTSAQYVALPSRGPVEIGVADGALGLRWIAGVRAPQAGVVEAAR